MNEDLLNKLLRRGMQRGDVPVELDDAAVDHWLNHETAELPDAIQASIKSKLKQRLQEASQTIAPVGRLIVAVRDGAGLSRADVSGRLGKTEEYLRQIEENDADFPNASAEEFATLMEILQLRFSKVSEAIHRSIDLWGFGSASGWQGAVSTGLKNDDKEHSQTDASTPWQKNRKLSLLSEKKKAAEAWLTNLQSVLRKRNRNDLLR
jgi:transcriptional regulator with XRE-family HTH domain